MLVTEKSSNTNFTRGDKASVSVRLRSNKTKTDNPGVKKRNRHSGDFSFFKHSNNKESNNEKANNNQNNGENDHDTTDGNKKENGDWAYITFENGVPTVQDIQTNVGPIGTKEPVGVIVNANGAPGGGLVHQPVPRPVKMISHQMPPSVVGQQNWQSQQNKRISGDFSMFAPPSHHPQQLAAVQARQATPPGAMGMRNGHAHPQMNQSPNKRSPVKKSSPPGTNVTKVMVQQPPRPNVIYRRKGEQNQNGGVAMHGGVAKRVSGEFDYGRHNLNRRSSSDYGLMIRENSQISEGPAHQQNKAPPSAPPPAVVRVQCNYNNIVNKGQRPKSMAFPGSSPDVVRGAVTPSPSNGPSKEGVASQQQQLPRPMGLGRRAVTQINIKKNGTYGSAMCKSQENLVKAKLDDEDLDGAGPELDPADADKMTALKKGLLWQQRDKLFSQWKERYFILTTDYLQCFKKGTSRITDGLMGEFIFKIKLCDVEEVELLDRRGYLVISVTLTSRGEGKIYLRKTEGIRDWFNSLKECVRDSKKRRTDRVNNGFWSNKQLTDSSSIEKWLMARKKIGLQYAYSNGEENSGNKKNGENENDLAKGARSEITLDELDDLYRSEEAEKEAELASKRLMMASHSNLVTSIKVNSATPPPVVRMRSRDDMRFNNNKSSKKINRLSLMSDIGLPDFGGQDLGIDLEKGIFVRKGKKSDNDSNDSGNNSMNTNGSVGSSNSSHSNPRDQNPREERLETHLEAEQSDEETDDKFIDEDFKGGSRRISASASDRAGSGGKRRSHMGLQITHV